jgi:ADP-ribosylglycohydrolase/predicted protein tyrosine phosphatase
MTDSARPRLTALQVDRAAGVLLGLACGDALGAGYEFQPARIHGESVAMVGGGGFGWAPGEWTDDTSMAVVIARVSATGADLRTTDALDAVTAGFVEWAAEANDIGVQTRQVLSDVRRTPTAQSATSFALDHFSRTRSTGNGSLMRTAPVALAFLHDPAGRAEAARAVSALTHGDDEAGEACALWCDAIAHAVLRGSLDGLRMAVEALPPERARLWSERLDHAEAVAPHEIPHNGWVVAALMAAWSAITHTEVPIDDPAGGRFAAGHLELAIEAAVRAGDDTDTVAAIAGGLLGARWGASAVPLAWQRRVHGWPGLRARDLVRLGLLTARVGRSDSAGWPDCPVQDYGSLWGGSALAAHPHDPGVLLGGIESLRSLPDGPEGPLAEATRADAVVSLCRLGAAEVPAAGVRPENHVEVWLVDSSDPERNAHLPFVLVQAADAVAALRAEGRTVLLHCVQAHSRTPTVAALYAARHLAVPMPQALREVIAALPDARPNAAFVAAMDELG